MGAAREELDLAISLASIGFEVQGQLSVGFLYLGFRYGLGIVCHCVIGSQ